MSKIIAALNAMLSNTDLITEVCQGTNFTEIFFKYDNKYKWSIVKNSDEEFFVHYYPGKESIQQLSQLSNDEWAFYSPMISYTNNEYFSTKEARSTVRELYTILKEKSYGMDTVLDDIINSDHISF